MKKNIFFIGILMFMFSCSTNNDNDNPDQMEILDNFRYLSEIRRLDPPSYDTGDVFVYEDNKLKLVYFPSHLELLNYFEYNSQNKVSKRDRDNLDNMWGQIWDSESFDLNMFIANAPYTNYIYSDGRLIEETNGGSPVVKYQYNGTGEIETIEIYYDENLAVVITLIYLNDGIDEMRVNDFRYNHYRVYNFEYDDKPNPFYTLYKKYGIPNLSTGRESFDLGYNYTDYHFTGLFKNNVTKMYVDGELKYTAVYQYDANGYPKRITFDNVFGGETGIENLTFLE